MYDEALTNWAVQLQRCEIKGFGRTSIAPVLHAYKKRPFCGTLAKCEAAEHGIPSGAILFA